MTEIIDWEICKQEFIKERTPDLNQIASIKETANNREQLIETIEINDKNASFIVEGYYEVIKELLTALLLKNGFRSKNHQCLISYLYKKFPEYEAEAYLVGELCFLRNRLDYYGEKIKLDYYLKNKTNIINTIAILRKILG